MPPWKLGRLAQRIERGAIFASPTDTIWGLGCHPLQYQSVLQLQHIKQRCDKKGLILLSADINYLTAYVALSELPALDIAVKKHSPNPVTWICKASTHCPDWLTGKRDGIAVRITNYEPISSLSHHLRSPLVSTSANISGRHPVRNSLLAHKYFNSQLDFIMQGGSRYNQQASQIMNLQTGKLLRG